MIDTRGITKENRLSHWTQVMRERNESGLSVKMFCERQGIAINTYFYWQRKLREDACWQMLQGREGTVVIPQGRVGGLECSSSAPVGWAICEESKGRQESSGITIEIGNSRICVSADVDPVLLGKVCRVLTAL